MDKCDEEKVQKLIAAHQRHVDYLRASTVLISALPIAYGALTFIFGGALWASNPIYRTALQVPGAPQSWGVIFIVMGTTTVAGSVRNHHLTVAISALSTSIVMASFMSSFLIESWRAASLYGMPPAVVYAIFSVAFLNRSRFSWATWRADSGRNWPWQRPE